MKIESLKLDKFKSDVLTREQMFMLNGCGTATAGGNHCDRDPATGVWENYDYGYDAMRSDGNGGYFFTYHNRTNVSLECPIGNG